MNELTKYLISMGLPGIVILGLAWALLKLYNQLTALTEQRTAEIVKLQRETVEVIERNTAALDKHSETLERVKLFDTPRRRTKGD